jgi:hypothetical protein
MAKETFYMGQEGMIWWVGVVEDRMDPDMLGKVRVRILGYHNDDKTYIASDQLQWCYVVTPVTSASMNGIGEAPLGLIPGSWVLGFFRDGPAMQEAVVFGSIGGIPQLAPDPTKGFNDPRNNAALVETLQGAPRQIFSRAYSKDGTGAHLINGVQGPQYPQTDFLLEPDTNRIARNQNIEQTILNVLKGILVTEIPIAFTGTWAEPPLYYNGVYPFVHVTQSESGHVKIIDDTPNAEGQLDIDRTGTFTENLTDGSEVHKVVGDGYIIVMRGNNILIMNQQNETVNKDYNLLIGGKWNVEVVGNINIKADRGGAYITVQGDANIKAGGNVNVEACGDANVVASRDVNVSAGSTVTVQSVGAINLVAGTNINMDTPNGFVWINSQMASGATVVHATEPPQ